MKNVSLLLTAILCLCTAVLFAQGENNNWTFGMRTGLSFNGPAPAFFQCSGKVFEGSASVSDAAGNLLFYASDTLWDRNGNYMPNGTGMAGNIMGSSAKGVAIVKDVANPARYYLVVTDGIEAHLYNAYYSVIDMSLNNGLGDVVPGQKNIMIDTGIAEGVVVMPIQGCQGYWVMLHSKWNGDYHAFRVDASGFATTPVISGGPASAPTNSFGNQGNMQPNNAHTRLMRGYNKIELSDFNSATGMLSNFVLIDPSPRLAFYNLFPPDDSKIYFADNDGIYQINISLLPNVTAVQNSIVTLDTGIYSGMRLGPDNKIYVARMTKSSIARINNPNNTGISCNLDPVALPLPPYSFYTSQQVAVLNELGNPVLSTIPGDTSYSVSDTNICFSNSATLNPGGSYDSYRWSTGGGAPQETVQQSGTYWRSAFANCNVYIDTIRVTFITFDPDLGPDTTICPGRSLLIGPGVADAGYRWQDGSTGSSYMVRQPGNYSVRVTIGPCSRTDSIYVSLLQPSLAIPQPDTMICKGSALMLQAIAFPASTFLWNTGQASDRITIDTAGLYTVTVSNSCGSFSDSVRIATENCNCNAFVPNAFTPNGDSRNDVLEIQLHCPGVTDYIFAIYNRYGQRIFETRNIQDSWKGLYHGGVADAGTYFYYLQYKNAQGEKINKKGDVVLIR